MSDITEKIVRQRKKLWLTKMEVAEKANISYKTYERLEKGQVKSMYVLEQVLKVFSFEIYIK